MQIVLDIFIFDLYLMFSASVFMDLEVWLLYANQKHLDDLDWKLLEIKLPRDIQNHLKPQRWLPGLPQAGGVGTLYNKYVKGALPIFFSLEIASLEGDVKFFVMGLKEIRSTYTE